MPSSDYLDNSESVTSTASASVVLSTNKSIGDRNQQHNITAVCIINESIGLILLSSSFYKLIFPFGHIKPHIDSYRNDLN